MAFFFGVCLFVYYYLLKPVHVNPALKMQSNEMHTQSQRGVDGLLKPHIKRFTLKKATDLQNGRDISLRKIKCVIASYPIDRDETA